MEKFEIGDVVELKTTSEFWGIGDKNPKFTNGVIVGNTRYSSNDLFYTVNWNNGKFNHYSLNDLDFIAKPCGYQRAEVGDTIEILDSVGASWVKKGNRYTVLEIHDSNLRLDTETNSDGFWATSPEYYEIIYRQFGELPYSAPVFDLKAIDKQLDKFTKDELLAKAKKDYPIGTTYTGLLDYKIKTVLSDDFYFIGLDCMYVKTNDGNTYVLYEGKWAGIIDYLPRQVGRFELNLPSYNFDSKSLNENHFDGLKEFLKINKKQQTGTENNKNVKLQGIDLKIREGNPVRGIGLKSTRSKVKFGGDYRYY